MASKRSSPQASPPPRIHIHSLANELLASIFAFCAEEFLTTDSNIDVYPFLSGTHRSKPPHACLPECRQWTRVLHVCRRWRDVALPNPALWVSPNFSVDQNYTRKMLDLSKSSLLALRLKSIDFGRWKVLEDYSWFSRCRELRLQLGGYARPDPLMSQMTIKPASSLEILSIQLDTPNQGFAIPMHWTETALKLKTLALKG
ncbi:hypothetical protein CONPUDRAFT_138806 [Coniophora puteana RWD-64-598 SS2]|uniref:Uncharacterized protein n=1 Tax=Coniophora puteana (strain RWD-64-598) TaxID=741705 RepID=A0A5M3MHY1_CONPW|nr:uncharacterized protein CONPUDRAFT_138806 [Coniophora puteana RWD-64-598 SS2]EIW78616.1 hypothetical protein CONPUDRAFT_138806 [Coniophora puteana RWD-64-598 SS2]